MSKCECGRIEIGRAHVDGDAAVGLQAQLEAAVHGLDDKPALVAQALVAHVADEAARAVAAVLDLVAAAAIEDAIAEVDLGPRRLFDDQDLVGADAEAPVGERLQLRGVERQRLARGVEDDEVVAGALHLGEVNTHDRDYRVRTPAFNTRKARPAAVS